jgi:hypothetical protein
MFSRILHHRHRRIAMHAGILCLAMTARADEIDDLVAKLGDESYAVRVEATQELIRRNVDARRLDQLAAATTDPEVRHRLMGILGFAGEHWAKLTRQEIMKLKPHGKENGQGLYLALATHDGSTVVGKYSLEWNGANFPIGDKEVHLLDFTIWTGGGIWKPWQPGMARMLVMGRTRDGKAVHAVRAKHMGGLHPGTLIEGEDKARIPWGENVHRLAEFEVLTAELE